MQKEKSTPDFIANEHAVMKFWEDNKCFEKLVKQNENGERFDNCTLLQVKRRR